MSKRAQSLYQPGKRGGAWVKVKTRGRQEFVIAGYTLGKGRRSKGIGALILAVERDGELVYVGNCGTGFDDRELDRLQDLLDPLRRDTCPLAEVPRMPRVRTTDVDLGRAEARVRGRSSPSGRPTDRLRAPVYMGLRDDKPAARCSASGRHGRAAQTRRSRTSTRCSGQTRSITKGDLIEYYREVADVLVPHLRDRPVHDEALPRRDRRRPLLPEGRAQAHARLDPHAARSRRRRASDRRKRMIRYPLVNEPAALVWMANMGCIDMNAWYSRADKPERPGLRPLRPRSHARGRVRGRGRGGTAGEGRPRRGRPARLPEDERRRRRARPRAARPPLHATTTRASSRRHWPGRSPTSHPELITTEWSKARRRGVLIDANQNGPGRTIASVYSVRPRPGAPVSTPVEWDELTPDLEPEHFTMAEVLGRIADRGDLYEPVLEDRQALGPALRNL